MFISVLKMLINDRILGNFKLKMKKTCIGKEKQIKM